MAQGGSSGKIGSKLVAGSFAAVLAVYTTGYARTQSAANRLAAQVAERRAAVPARERVVIQGPTRPAAPIPERLQPPTAERTRDILPSTNVETARVQKSADTKADIAASIAQPVHIETPEPPSLPAPSVTAAPVVASAPAPAVLPVPVAAPAPAPAPSSPAPTPAPAKPVWKDGTYTGWGYSRHGNIQAAVVIQAGRILSANITQCQTRYSCDVIDRIIPQVAQRQSSDVDYVSGATESADAFYGAVFEALGKAK
jgi:uncharacterized protein with FMN-binding domain